MDIIHIATNLRLSWLQEIQAQLPHYGTPEELLSWAERMSQMPEPKCLILTKDGEPAVMGGFVQQGHIATSWCAGTERAAEPDVAARFMVAVLRAERELIKAGVRRFQAMVLAGIDDLTQRWLDRMGYEREGFHPGVGCHGETFVSYGKVVDHV